MVKTTLMIMAAGMGSRFGGGIKQLASVGPSGEIIMDYSIYDAVEAGFDEVVFIIRHDLEKDFKEIIGDRISKIIPVKYAFQELDDLPDGFIRPIERTKPWGTGQAVLAAKSLVDNPFAVINADDYYGKEAFARIHDYLVSTATPYGKKVSPKGVTAATPYGKKVSPEGVSTAPTHTDSVFHICMAGFMLENTLSENGGVTRGICKMDENGDLVKLTETFDIQRKDGILCGRDENGTPVIIQENQKVSMNMWGLQPDFLEELERGFTRFLSNLGPQDLKREYLLPRIIDQLLQEKRAEVKVLETNDKWFGVTYQEDRQGVAEALRELVKRGVYKEKLF